MINKKKIVFDLEEFKEFLKVFNDEHILYDHPTYERFETEYLINKKGKIYSKRWGIKSTLKGKVKEVIDEIEDEFLQGKIDIFIDNSKS